MTLPASGQISFSQVNTELGQSSNTAISLGQSSVRTLFGKASGVIALSDGYGKANQFAFAVTANQTNANLASLATTAGWNGSSKVVATINSGVIISSNSTGIPALTISSFPSGIDLINNGTIVGMGGSGGSGGDAQCALNWPPYGQYANPGNAGGSGGTGLSVTVATSVTNNGVIAGGGGGGGGGGGNQYSVDDGETISWYAGGGGGGGGGRSSNVANSGAGGGGNGYATGFRPSYGYNGSAGGAGSYSTAGGGGGGAAGGGTGGAGATWGSTGSVGGASGGAGGAGGAGGSATVGASNITWVATGTRYGAIN